MERRKFLVKEILFLALSENTLMKIRIPKIPQYVWSKEKIYEQAPDIQCILSELNAHH